MRTSVTPSAEKMSFDTAELAEGAVNYSGNNVNSAASVLQWSVYEKRRVSCQERPNFINWRHDQATSLCIIIVSQAMAMANHARWPLLTNVRNVAGLLVR